MFVPKTKQLRASWAMQSQLDLWDLNVSYDGKVGPWLTDMWDVLATTVSEALWLDIRMLWQVSNCQARCLCGWETTLYVEDLVNQTWGGVKLFWANIFVSVKFLHWGFIIIPNDPIRPSKGTVCVSHLVPESFSLINRWLVIVSASLTNTNSTFQDSWH